VRFLSDFKDKVDMSSLRSDQFGMLEQVVASRGRAFVGVWWSTFTGYIMRMRGYHGLEKDSWYAMPEYRNEMQRYQEPEGPGWWREWPTCWTKID
jgi:hypothetical protein